MPSDEPIRKRMKRRERAGDIRFVTFSCYRRLPLLRHAAISRLFVETLASVHARMRFELYAYVVMPEHVHLLIRPGTEYPMDRILVAIKHRVARTVIARWRTLQARVLQQIETPSGARFWQKGGGFDRNVRSVSEFTRAVHYIHQNPVSRGLVNVATEWEYLSVHAWLARYRGRPIEPSPRCDSPPGREDWLKWAGFMEWPDGLDTLHG